MGKIRQLFIYNIPPIYIYIKWKRFYSFVIYLLLQFWSQEAEIWTQTPRNIVDDT